MSVVSPLPLVFSSTTGGTSTYTGNGLAYDYALGGIPLLSAASDEQPYRRQTAPYRKEQLDQSADPGEQSLVFWWLRSQSSFHGGAGRKFSEATDQRDQDGRISFESSVGVDPWTPGQLTLLPKMQPLLGVAASCFAIGALDGTTPIVLQASGNTLTRVTSGGSAAVTWGGTGTILSLASDGTNYYAADATGVYRGTLAGGAGTLIWNTGSPNVKLAWVKQRLMAAIGSKIYELTGTGPALPAAKYTHPNAGWVWTAFSEGPTQILASGYAGEQSAVHSFALNSSGEVPTLSSGTTVAQLPTGEVIHSLYVYLGAFLLFGTSRGVRVGLIDSTQVTFGPLTITSSSPVYGFVGRGDFVYATATDAINNASGLWRISLGMELFDGRYPHATDLQTKVTGTVRSVALLGDDLVVTVDGHGSFVESLDFEDTGTVTTARIRYSTLEPKLYKFLRLRTTTEPGLLSATVVDASGTAYVVATNGAASNAGDAEIQLYMDPTEYVQITLELKPDAGGTSPVVQGYQLKALPAQKRQRMEMVTVLLYDFEADRNGQRTGYAGSALERLIDLETMEEDSDIVLFQHLRPGENQSISRLVVIDEVRFAQQAPPAKFGGWGGTVELVLRSVT